MRYALLLRVKVAELAKRDRKPHDKVANARSAIREISINSLLTYVTYLFAAIFFHRDSYL